MLWSLFNGARFFGKSGYCTRRITALRYLEHVLYISNYAELDRYPDQKLKPGGLLLLDQCSFNFMDVDPLLRTRYGPALWSGNLTRRRRPMFNQHNRKVSSQHLAFRMFIKKSTQAYTA